MLDDKNNASKNYAKKTLENRNENSSNHRFFSSPPFILSTQSTVHKTTNKTTKINTRNASHDLLCAHKYVSPTSSSLSIPYHQIIITQTVPSKPGMTKKGNSDLGLGLQIGSRIKVRVRE